jgi:hypothetical protein
MDIYLAPANFVGTSPVSSSSYVSYVRPHVIPIACFSSIAGSFFTIIVVYWFGNESNTNILVFMVIILF